MKTISCTIKGITPLLMHRFPLEPIPGIDKKSPEEQAEIAAYRDPDGLLYVPGVCVQQSIISAAVFSKGRGRASLQKFVAACIMISPKRIVLNAQEYVIDARPVVVPRTSGRIIRYRPRIDNWELSFDIGWEPTLFTETQLREVVDNAGKLVGILDFRPEKKGSFGRFIVTEWK